MHRPPRACLPQFLPVIAFVLAVSSAAMAQAPSGDAARPATAGEAAAPESGIATIYSTDMEGQLTASGEGYNSRDLTAAHRTLPLGTRVKVTNLGNDAAVVVRINDRWGGGPGRVINLSSRAATELGFGSSGTVSVRLDVQQLGTPELVRQDAARAPAAMVAGGAAPLPARVADTDTSRFQQCRNQADILGLDGALHQSHVRNCLSAKRR